MSQDDFDALDDFICDFATELVYRTNPQNLNYDMNKFFRFMEEHPEVSHSSEKPRLDIIIRYVKKDWETIKRDIDGNINIAVQEWKAELYESVWNDIRKKSLGVEKRIEKGPVLTKEEYKLMKSILDAFVWYCDNVSGHQYNKDILKDCLKYFNEWAVSVRGDKDEYAKLDFEKVKQYLENNWDSDSVILNMTGRPINESVWNDIRNKSLGKEERIEGEMDEHDFDMLKEFAKMFKNYCAIRDGGFKVKHYHDNNCDGFVEYIIRRKEEHLWPDVEDDEYDKIIKHVRKTWGDSKNIKEYLYTLMITMNESVWGDLRKKSLGKEYREENLEKINGYDSNELYQVLRNSYVMNSDSNLISIEKPSTGKITIPLYVYDSVIFRLIYYMNDGFLKNDIHAQLRCDDTLINKLRKRFYCLETGKGMHDRISNYIILPDMGKEPDNLFMIEVLNFIVDNLHRRYKNKLVRINNILECDGVPGGLTPADVGGMGPAYFPGPNGEPGSGDLPSPTGKVYQQVAPFGIFVNSLYGKRKKKRKKKFRKEDEPCVHSPNAKVYDYVDDYREYVDRTYNNMDRKR